MCSELFRIPIRVGAVPLFGFGVLLAAWLAGAGWAMWCTARQFGWPAAAKAHLPTLLIVAAAIALAVPRMFPAGVPVRGYGVMVLCGSILGVLMALRRAEQVNLAAEHIVGLAVGLFVSGVFGARLFYVIEYWDSRIKQPDAWGTLKEALKFTEGGLVVYGAFFGAVAWFLWYVRRHKLPLLALADLVAPSLLAGLALGRIGCFLNGCCYGGESTAAWAVTFPRMSAQESLSPVYADQAAAGRFYGLRLSTDDSSAAAGGAVKLDKVDADSAAARAGAKSGDRIAKINGRAIRSLDDAQSEIFEAFRGGAKLELGVADGRTISIAAVEPPPRSRPVHPAQLYSAIDAGLLAWFLWAYYPFRRREGEVVALMLTLHPISRFLLEIIRVDESAVWNTRLSISQNLSLGLLAIALCLWAWLARQPKNQLDFPLPALA